MAGVKAKSNGTDQLKERERDKNYLACPTNALDCCTYNSAQYEYTSRWLLPFPRSACSNSAEHIRIRSSH